MSKKALTLYFREYCSLCHDMLAQLQPFAARFDFHIDVIDVDADPVLEEKYNELVPVLLDGEHEICHWHLDTQRLLARLAAQPGEIG